MDADAFLQLASDPEAWRKKSRSLRRSADVLWAAFQNVCIAYGKAYKAGEEPGEGVLDTVIEFMMSAQMLYGLALETAFKGYILRLRPDKVQFKIYIIADGTRRLGSVEIGQIGVALKEGHNLLTLTEIADVFRRDEHAIFKVESDFKALTAILEHLTEMVLWQARYPVPTRNEATDAEYLNAAPSVLFGHHIRDYIDPLLDHYTKAAENPPV